MPRKTLSTFDARVLYGVTSNCESLIGQAGKVTGGSRSNKGGESQALTSDLGQNNTTGQSLSGVWPFVYQESPMVQPDPYAENPYGAQVTAIDDPARDKLCFALDVPDGGLACNYAKKLQGHVGCFKVGLELFIASGPILLSDLRKYGPIFLDLKLHDIPATVARAVTRAKQYGVRYLTVHVGDEGEALQAAQEAAGDEVKLLGITVLTSCKDATAVLPRAHAAQAAGLWGVVCSGQETAQIREACPRLKIVNPGIRPSGKTNDDQARVVTPTLAIEAGAELLVVGRPIRDAQRPEQMADAIVAEIRGAIGDR